MFGNLSKALGDVVSKVEDVTGVDIDRDGKVGVVRTYDPANPEAARAAPTGACKALYIGINYFGQNGELRGCVNDVKMMRGLIERFGFPQNNTRVLVDDPDFPGRTGDPTKKAIMEGMQWLVAGAQPGDTLFMHYSGHGTQVPDQDGDEDDGMDEALCPVDYARSGIIRDDDILRTLIAPLPEGVRLTAIMDCCHSGSLMDLPFMWVASDGNLSSAASAFAQGLALPPMHTSAQWLKPEFLNALLGSVLAAVPKVVEFVKTVAAQSTGERSRSFEIQSERGDIISSDVIMFSGCKDEQTSADVSSTSSFQIPADAGPGGAGGACTAAFTEVITQEPNLPFVQLLEKMQANLKRRRFTQVPQLSSSKPVDLAKPFSLFGPIHKGVATAN
eukprot:PhM_4_TR17878/c0_g2_i1/m.11050